MEERIKLEYSEHAPCSTNQKCPYSYEVIMQVEADNPNVTSVYYPNHRYYASITKPAPDISAQSALGFAFALDLEDASLTLPTYDSCLDVLHLSLILETVAATSNTLTRPSIDIYHPEGKLHTFRVKDHFFSTREQAVAAYFGSELTQIMNSLKPAPNHERDLKVVNVRRVPFDPQTMFYIGRGDKNHKRSVLCNPTRIRGNIDRTKAIQAYRRHLSSQIESGNQTVMKTIYHLNKDLACYCAPQACHGDVILLCRKHLRKEYRVCSCCDSIVKV